MRIVVIGNGIAGDTAALTVRAVDRSAAVTLVSQDVEGLFSPCVFPHCLAGELRRERVLLSEPEHLRKQGIDAIFGQRALAIDAGRRIVRLQEGELAYDRLIVATGSQPLIPSIPGVEKPGVFALKSVRDLDGICAWVGQSRGKTVAVMGSGPIGVEVAIAMRKRGHAVYLLVRRDRILRRLFDPEPARMLQGILEAHGIQVLTNEQLEGITGEGRVGGIVTNRRRLACDMLVLASGMRPSTQLAQTAGIELGASTGIAVDAQMMTSVEGIYACGDCVETADIPTGTRHLSLLWHTAKLQAHVAACNCVGLHKTYPGSLNFTTLGVFGQQAFSSGNTLEDLHQSEVCETPLRGGCLRVILNHDVIVALQWVGQVPPVNVGMILGMIRTRQDIRELRRLLHAGSVVHQPRILLGCLSLLEGITTANALRAD